LKLNGTHQVLVYDDDFNTLAEAYITKKKHKFS